MSAGKKLLVLSVLVCALGAGTATAQVCEGDEDCREDSFCNLQTARSATGMCQSGEVDCEDDDECPSGLSCDGGTCTFVLESCRSDADCDDNFRCVDMTPCDPEGGSSDCQNGDDTQCYPDELECSSSDDCPDTWSCEDDACLPYSLSLVVRGHAPVATMRRAFAQQAADGDPAEEEAQADAGGCSVARTGAPSAASAFAPIAALMFLLGRRKQRGARRK